MEMEAEFMKELAKESKELEEKQRLLNKYFDEQEGLSEVRFTKREILRIGDVLSESLYQLGKLLSVYKAIQSEKVDEVADLYHEVEYLKTLVGKKNVDLLKMYLKEES